MRKFKLKEKCETCSNISGLTRSHFVKKNSVHKSIKDYDYQSELNWFTQCLKCHMAYERLPVRFKNNPFKTVTFMVTRESYLMRKGLFVYANRVKYLVEGV